jgi:adenylyltransferase/sulfurtransferase
MPAREESEPPVAQIRAVDLADARSRGEELLLLDVREPDEFAKASIPGSLLIPLGELEQRVGELSEWRDRRVVVHCRTGARSARACEQLRELGFSKLENLDGGIEAWSLTVDDGVPRY